MSRSSARTSRISPKLRDTASRPLTLWRRRLPASKPTHGSATLKAFHVEQAKGFKAHLADQRNARSGEQLSKATLYATLTALKRFFVWLAGQPGYKSRISYSDADYFNLATKDARVAKATRPERVPTLEQIRHVI